jgi:spoIIIJ-associated protein
MDQELIKNEILSFLEKMGFKDEVESIDIHQGVVQRFGVKIRERSNMLIGERGVNLAAAEYLLKRVVAKKTGADFKFTLDVNDYRIKRLEGLKQDVKTAARKVRLYQCEVPLRAMSAFERRIVHLLLAEYPDIATESVGQEPKRRVVIKPYP